MAIARQYCPRWRWGAHAQPQEAYVSLQGNSRRHTQGGWDPVDATKMYLINLSDEERQMLLEMTRKGEIKARKFK